jgi:hypothetical protein
VGGERIVRPFITELLSGPLVKGEPAPHGLEVIEDPLFRKSLDFELSNQMRKFRKLAKGFQKDYLEPLNKAEAHFLSDLQANHSAVQRRRRKKETLERAKSTPSYDQLANKAMAIGTDLDPNFETNRREILKMQHKRKRIEELLVEEPDAPAHVDPAMFYDLLDFINHRFATRRGSQLWTEQGFSDFFDAISFKRSWLHSDLLSAQLTDTVCANEWVTMLTSLGFPRSHAELLQLYRDLSEHGVLTRGTFTKVAPIGCLLWDCKTYGVHQARIQQITRKQGYQPTAPQKIEDSVYDLVHGTAPDGSKSVFQEYMDKEKEAVAVKQSFMEEQKKDTLRRRKTQQANAAAAAGYNAQTGSNDEPPTPHKNIPRTVQEDAHFKHTQKGSVLVASVDFTDPGFG